MTKLEIREYFEKAPKRQKFITEIKRCVAHEYLGKLPRKADISRMIYGTYSPSLIHYLFTQKPENQEVIDNWKEWIEKGIYPVSKTEYHFVEPITKSQQKYANKEGLVRINRVGFKLVKA
jgi:hypothetical protein